MKALKIIPFNNTEKNIFTYSFEPGAEILGIIPTKNGIGASILAVLDPNEPATEKHKFMCFTFEQGCTKPEYIEMPEESAFYLGTVGDFHYFEMLE